MLKKLYVHLLRNPNSHRKEAKRRKPFKKDDDALRLHWPLMPKAGEVALWPRPLPPLAPSRLFGALSSAETAAILHGCKLTVRSLFYQHLPAHVVGVLPQLQCTLVY